MTGPFPAAPRRRGQPLAPSLSRTARSTASWIWGAIRFLGSYWFALVLFSALCAFAGGILGSEFGVDNLLRAPSRFRPAEFSAFFRTDGRFLTAAYVTCASAFIVILAHFNVGGGGARAIEADDVLAKIRRVFSWMSLPLILFILTKLIQREPVFIYDLEDLGWTTVGILVGLTLSAALVIGWHLTITRLHSKASLLYFFIFLFSFNYLTTATVAGLAVLALFGWAALVYFASATLDRAWRGVIILIFLGLLTVGGLERYKHRLPGLSDGANDYYDQPVIFPENSCPAIVGELSDAQLVNPIEALRAWRRQFSAPPKLVVVAASGGGYRAAFWTALVLDKIGELSVDGAAHHPIVKHFRLLTGASGGMVALAYFASALTPEGKLSKSIEAQLRADVAADLDRFLGRSVVLQTTAASQLDLNTHAVDSLSAITHALVHNDIPALFWPRPNVHDRGYALERQWVTLDRSLESLASGELSGWRPSLILTPVILERGSPLLISNLDLSSVAGQDCRLAVEFFKLFPRSRNIFRLNTAVRINAAFPVISPTTRIPTNPPMRVVDAGYYDNYGTDTATAFLQNPDVQQWVRKNTSGIIILQISAYPISSRTTRTKGSCEIDDSITGFSLTSALWRGLESMTTALEGLNSTRSAGNLHRAERQVALLKMIYPRQEDGSEFVQRITFENHAHASLSWHLPTREVDCMREQLAQAHNQASFLQLRRTLNVGP